MARTAVIAGTAGAAAAGVAHRQQSKFAAQQAGAEEGLQRQQMAEMEAQVAALQAQAVATPAPAAADTPEQDPGAAAAPPVGALTMEQKIAQLEELAELKQAGILSEAEFEVEKQKVLTQ
jgi:hypothetical protein